jgi:hypothetical protein
MAVFAKNWRRDPLILLDSFCRPAAPACGHRRKKLKLFNNFNDMS